MIGVARPDSIPQAAERLHAFLAAGAHGDMDWMAKNADRRGDPRTLWAEVGLLAATFGLAFLLPRRAREGLPV